MKDTEKIVQLARKNNITVLTGGYFATMSPEVVLNSGLADVVVLREGEITTEEVLTALSNNTSIENILGIVYKKDRKVYVNSDRPFDDLKDFPELDWNLINPNERRLFHG